MSSAETEELMHVEMGQQVTKAPLELVETPNNNCDLELVETPNNNFDSAIGTLDLLDTSTGAFGIVPRHLLSFITQWTSFRQKLALRLTSSQFLPILDPQIPIFIPYCQIQKYEQEAVGYYHFQLTTLYLACHPDSSFALYFQPREISKPKVITPCVQLHGTWSLQPNDFIDLHFQDPMTVRLEDQTSYFQYSDGPRGTPWAFEIQVDSNGQVSGESSDILSKKYSGIFKNNKIDICCDYSDGSQCKFIGFYEEIEKPGPTRSLCWTAYNLQMPQSQTYDSWPRQPRWRINISVTVTKVGSKMVDWKNYYVGRKGNGGGVATPFFLHEEMKNYHMCATKSLRLCLASTTKSDPSYFYWRLNTMGVKITLPEFFQRNESHAVTSNPFFYPETNPGFNPLFADL